MPFSYAGRRQRTRGKERVPCESESTTQMGTTMFFLCSFQQSFTMRNLSQKPESSLNWQAESWSNAATLQASQGEFQPLRNSQVQMDQAPERWSSCDISELTNSKISVAPVAWELKQIIMIIMQSCGKHAGPSFQPQNADCCAFLQHGQQATIEISQPELTLPRDDSPRTGPEDWRVQARHSTAHKRWPSNASRSVRGAMTPGTSWNTPTTDLAGGSLGLVLGVLQ